MSLDVVYVNPNSSKSTYQDLADDLSAIEPPIWAAMLAQHSRVKGYSTRIIDADAERLDAATTAVTALEGDPRLIVIVVYGQQPSASSQNMQGASELCDELKQSSPGTHVMMLGGHPSAISRATMLSERCDFVCQGEGPRTIDVLLETNMIDAGQLKKVPGLWYRESGMIRCTPQAKLITQDELAAELPGMAWDMLPMKWYRTSNWHALTNGNIRMPFASLYSSLGCPFKCHYCMINSPFGSNNLENSVTQQAFRYWDTEFTLSQFDKIAEMGIRNVKIADEMFVMNRKHYLSICDELAERGHDFNIWAYARIDTVKQRYLERMRAAGIRWLALGIESGNTKVRQEATKGVFTDTDIRDVVQQIKDAGISVIGNFIFGLPEDDEASMRQTFELAQELNCDFTNFYSAMAYPGSKLYLDALREGWELPDSYSGFSQHSYDCKPLPTKHLTAAQVLAFRDDAFHTYHESPHYLWTIEEKFGRAAANELRHMTSKRLRRKLLEQQ